MRTSSLRPRGVSRVLYARVYVNGERFERSTGTADMEEAQRVLAGWEREAEDQTDRSEGPTATLEQALDLLLEDRRAKARAGDHSAATIRFYEQHAGLLIGALGASTPIAQWEKDVTTSWRYIDTRRSDGTKDIVIKKELGTLRMALAIADERGLFHGNPDRALPSTFNPAYKPRQRSLAREDVAKLLPHLNPNAAAVVTYVLATSAEFSAIERALRSDVPDLAAAGLFIPVRGTKNANRNRVVPVVLDEQRLLLGYTLRHAGGRDGALFSGLENLRRDLRHACKRANVPHCSPHDLRHTAGQWFVDLGCPIEIVSRMLGHSSTAVTERIYARVKQEALGDRVRAALPEHLWSVEASHGATKALKLVPLVTLPEPRWQVYEIDGVKGTLSQWAKARGVPKGTLYYRLKTLGLPMEQALAMGRWGRVESPPAEDLGGTPAPNVPQIFEPVTRPQATLPVEGSTSAPHVVDARGRSGRALGQPKSREPRKPRAAAVSRAPTAGLEPATRRLTAACSTN